MTQFFFNKDRLADAALHESAHAVCAEILRVPFLDILLCRDNLEYFGYYNPDRAALQQAVHPGTYEQLCRQMWLHIPHLASLEAGHMGPCLVGRQLANCLYRTDRECIDNATGWLIEHLLCGQLSTCIQSSVKAAINDIAVAVIAEHGPQILAVAMQLIKQTETGEECRGQQIGRRTLLAETIRETMNSSSFPSRAEFESFILGWSE